MVDALLGQPDTRVLVPSGTIFREQNIILAPAGEESMPRFFAPTLFMGAAAVGPQGVMQPDVVLVSAERRLIDRADKVVLLVDSSKFSSSSGAIVCGLDEIGMIITDRSPGPEMERHLAAAGIELVLAG
jgi:DeoR family ulaG and ulaABCDEF operon transcriptional repressor